MFKFPRQYSLSPYTARKVYSKLLPYTISFMGLSLISGKVIIVLVTNVSDTETPYDFVSMLCFSDEYIIMLSFSHIKCNTSFAGFDAHAAAYSEIHFFLTQGYEAW